VEAWKVNSPKITSVSILLKLELVSQLKINLPSLEQIKLALLLKIFKVFLVLAQSKLELSNCSWTWPNKMISTQPSVFSTA
jgi:hypothetical protein